MEEKEIWVDIEGYEGMYQVSNMGRVKSLERTAWNNRGYYRTLHERILKGRKVSNGYLQVQLCQDGKAKNYLVHRLVASAFLENPMGYNEVNHIDEDKENNKADNLEWCSKSYNLSYNDRAKKVGKKVAEKLSKPVLAIHKINGLILEFPSIHEASRVLRIDQGNITRCCQGKYMTANGYTFFYANANDDDDTE